jgi:hypothetical protein
VQLFDGHVLALVAVHTPGQGLRKRGGAGYYRARIRFGFWLVARAVNGGSTREASQEAGGS